MKSMTAQQVPFVSLVLVALAVTTLVGADGKSPYAPPAGQATLVFVQNQPKDYVMEYTVYGPDKLCVAKVIGRDATVVPMSPGSHTLYIASDDNQRIDVDLEPGRAYFVHLAPEERVSVPTSGITPVQRGSQAHKLIKTWLDGARVIQASQDPCHGKPLKERANRTIRRMNEANAAWDMRDAEYRAQYSLRKEDGFSAEELGWL